MPRSWMVLILCLGAAALLGPSLARQALSQTEEAQGQEYKEGREKEKDWAAPLRSLLQKIRFALSDRREKPPEESLRIREFGPEESCGKDRLPVKTLSDREASLLKPDQPEDAAIERLKALTPPGRYPLSRRAQAEKTVWRVKADLSEVGIGENRGYRLLLTDVNESTHTLTAYIVDSRCPGAGRSRFAARFEAARGDLERIAGVRSPYPKPFSILKLPQPVPVVVTGVGFFDADGIRLFPVLSIRKSEP